MFYQVRLCLLLGPQPTKAQVQSCKAFFQLQMKKQRRLKQIMITIAPQCTRHCTALVVLWNSSPCLFWPSLSVLGCNLTTVAIFPISLSLLIVVMFSFSCNCKVLLIMPPHSHSFCPNSFWLFIVCDTLLVVPSCCLRKSVCWISCCLIFPPLLSHLVLVADCI